MGKVWKSLCWHYWAQCSLDRNLTRRVQQLIFVIVSHPSRLAQAMQAPFDWCHADLEDVRVYLRSQAAAGLWKPKFTEGL